MGIQLKHIYVHVYHSIILRWAVLRKKQDGGRIKICEIFCGYSLKEDLSIDTTFVIFRETVPSRGKPLL